MDGYPGSPTRKEAAEFQRSPVRGRPTVNKLVPKKLTRTTTDDTQTAINRVVHEALARAGGDTGEALAAEVRRRVELVLEAKEDELKGRITHQQRLELIRLVATLSVDEAIQELNRMQLSASDAAEQKVKSDTSVPPLIWRRILCSYNLNQWDVMTLAPCCRFLRQDHALGLHRLVLPCLLEGLEDTTLAPLSTQPKAMPSVALKAIVYKFRYAQTLIASRAMRLHDADFELLKVSQLQRLDLSFCRNLAEEKLLSSLRGCFCLQDLCLRGCTQLTTPSLEEALQKLTTLNYLDLRGCENLKPDSVVKTVAEDLQQLRTLRFGFECQEKLWPFGAKIPMMSLTLPSWDVSRLNLRHLEIDLALVDKEHPDGEAGVRLMLKEGVLALLKLKFLDVLMLWNPLMLQQETFRAIVERFRPNVDGFVLEDCYHSQEAYFHVVPSTWNIHDRDSLDEFSAKAFPPVLDRSSKRRILTAVNVARDPESAITAMVTPIVQLCDIEDVILLDEYTFPPIPTLASSKVRSLELRFTPNTAQDYFRDFICPFIRASPELRRLRMNLGFFYSRHLGQQYEILLKDLTSCQHLEEIEFLTLGADEWPPVDRSQALAEYHDHRGPKTNKVVTASLDTVQTLLQSCRRLRRVKLLPPSVECRVSFYRLLSAMDVSIESLDLVSAYADTRGTSDLNTELENLPEIISTAAAPKLSVNFGMALTQPICDAILSTRLRSLRVERVTQNDPFFQMFAMLPMQSPFLEELALGHLTITSAYELTFLDTLCAFRHLSLLQLRALEGDGLAQLAGILPRVVQQNRRTLETLYLEDLDAKTLLSCIAGCRNLRRLDVAKSLSATLRPCADFPSGAMDLCMKVIARCPKLWSLHLNMVAPDEPKDLERHILQMGRGLKELVDKDVDFYRGLQYNDGREADPNRVESDDDEPDDD